MNGLTRKVVLPVLMLLPLLGPDLRAQEGPSGKAGQEAVVELSAMIADYLERIEQKLVDDEECWTRSMDLVQSLGRDLRDAAVLDRQQFLRAEAIVRYRNVWSDESFRRPILLRLAEVDLAMDKVSQAELELLRARNGERTATLEGLIALVGQLKTGQQELTAYLQDSSLSKKVGEIDASGVAVALAEARALRHSLAGVEGGEANVEAERERLQQAVEGFRSFLDYLDGLGDGEERRP